MQGSHVTYLCCKGIKLGRVTKVNCRSLVPYGGGTPRACILTYTARASSVPRATYIVCPFEPSLSHGMGVVLRSAKYGRFSSCLNGVGGETTPSCITYKAHSLNVEKSSSARKILSMATSSACRVACAIFEVSRSRLCVVCCVLAVQQKCFWRKKVLGDNPTLRLYPLKD